MNYTAHFFALILPRTVQYDQIEVLYSQGRKQDFSQGVQGESEGTAPSHRQYHNIFSLL